MPSKYLPKDDQDIPAETLQHLKWIMQKDLLGQDVFLIGRPGPLRRQVAMQYLQLTQREIEYVALSRDTTESGTLFYSLENGKGLINTFSSFQTIQI